LHNNDLTDDQRRAIQAEIDELQSSKKDLEDANRALQAEKSKKHILIGHP
jgi:ABC-type phosphate transport system auxiliary subunit